MAALSETQLIYVSPEPGHSGVGDYALDFVSEVKPHFRRVVECWVEHSSDETALDVVRNVRKIRAHLREAAKHGPVIVHFEQSAGSLTPFWAAMLPRRILVTATVHDAPQPVWWPFDTSLIKRHRLLHHAVHYPFRFVTNALQRRVCKDRIVATLTSVGARQTQLRQPDVDARATRHPIASRPVSKRLPERPLAIGLFGHLYRGKGFEELNALRAQLDDDIQIVIAGRGTDSVPSCEGIEVLGEVNDAAEDAFFESIRCLVVWYDKKSRYGRGFPASGAISRSYAYGTPILCNLDGALPEIAAEGGAVSIDGYIEDLARRANVLVRDEEMLAKLADEIGWLQSERTVAHCAAPLLEAWTELVSTA